MLQIYLVCGLPQNKNLLLQYYKKFVLLRSKYVIAVFCGLFKGFYLVVQ